ncbi:peptide chain release factor N(5)-glutamine methyltransferase [Vagococcus sp.]|uniref:peptide chain release factor N(5)-glutamine methyltransferase n=1 Tax=Vagococcus sp. TaxID=1933889 RepID=UPI000ED982BC|nr:peptide chain release factor N(5)-glutamine methyltransferase [Vagococcus sp.]HCT96146.1 peptide chain release factor N(5)-glutamine methyltransferase [Vagococcus sp.]
MVNRTYGEVLNWASSFLEKCGKDTHIAAYLIRERQQWTQTDLLIHLRQPMPEQAICQLEHDLKRIEQDYPAQYIIGECDFYGERLIVTEETLIPRPETEELVALCLERFPNTKKELTVVDVGTGTGAIALALKRHRPHWHVIGLDISKNALNVAKQNAEKLQLDVVFIESDLLQSFQGKADIVISNPPYIANSEWSVMDESVRKYEPTTALFAENDGYAIYHQLFNELPRVMGEKGALFLEHGYLQQAQLIADVKKKWPDSEVKGYPDMAGQDRMIEMSWNRKKAE